MRIALAVCLLQVTLYSQEPVHRKGAQDLFLYVDPDLEGVTGDTLVADMGYGYFLTPQMRLGLSAGLKTVEDIAPGEKDYRYRSLELSWQYVFEHHGRFMPYIGVSAGMASLNYLELHTSSLAYGPDLGLQFFVTKRAAIDFSAKYRTSSQEVFVNDFKLETNDLNLKVGIRVTF